MSTRACVDAGDEVDHPAAATSGEETVLNADLSAGRYAMLCFISAPDGEPHALKGMHTEFTVGEGSERSLRRLWIAGWACRTSVACSVLEFEASGSDHPQPGRQPGRP